MKGWLLLLLIPFAGCLGQAPQTLSEERGDAASATYVGPGGEFVLQASRSPVWTPHAERTQGILVTVNGGTVGDGLVPETDTAAFAVDDCRQPLWRWYGPLEPIPERASGVRFANSPSSLSMLQLAWSLERAELPPTGTAVLERGQLDLHVRRSETGWAYQWSQSGAPANESRWHDTPGTEIRWSDAPFPDSFGLYKLASWTNGGERRDCLREPGPAPQGWGRWGPLQDPPIGHSYNDMVQQALDDPLLLGFQSARQAKPDGYIFNAHLRQEDPSQPMLPPRDAVWYLSFGAAGDTTGIGISCTVNDLGGEGGLDVYRCYDTGTWQMLDGLAVPVPPTFPTPAADHVRFFEMASRWSPATFHPLDFSFDQFEDGLSTSMTINDAWLGDGADVQWDPLAGNLHSVRGLAFAEFLNPPA